mmetsp:Transcript_19555/g.50501  ORF Transcript_19555/g.50501 Transcript_19555/m.50501 type:complete len:195 (-) Transcript_19555:156-740(-)
MTTAPVMRRPRAVGTLVLTLTLAVVPGSALQAHQWRASPRLHRGSASRVRAQPTAMIFGQKRADTDPKSAAKGKAGSKPAKDGSKVELPGPAGKLPSLFADIKEAGLAGIIALTLVEGTFWFSSVPLSVFVAHQQTGEWNLDVFGEQTRTGTLAFIAAFVSVGGALEILTVRLGVALALVPFFKNILRSRRTSD